MNQNRWKRAVGLIALLSIQFCGCSAPAKVAGPATPADSGSTTTAQQPATPFKETVFDFKALTSTPLNAKVLKSTEKDGIVTEEIMFHSEMDGDKSVDIFGYFCYPKDGKNLPAFIWNQGGLYQATTYFPELGAKRGYAGLCIDFPIPGYRSTGGYPINSEPTMIDNPREAPIYHGAVALLKAVSYLESRPEVDKNRIGMAGSSWGGFFTTLMAGVDPRLKAASAMFGSGSLQLGNSWWDGGGNSANRTAEFREKWRTTLDPAWRLQASKTPISWATGTDDMFYWMPSVMKTYEMAAGPKNLTLLPNWDHALTPNLDEQVFAWLDVYLQGKPDFLKVSPLKLVQQGERKIAQWSFSGPRKAKAAELLLSYGEPGNWSGRYWHTLKAEMKGNDCSVMLPVSAVPAYLSGTVIDEDNFRYSTPLIYKDTALELSKGMVSMVPQYNGAGEWGDFEQHGEQYAKLHGYAYPTISTDAYAGKGSGVLQAGKTTLPPILFTASLPDDFMAFLKADKPVQVTVTLSGNFDGKNKVEQKEFSVGTKWTPVAISFTPLKALSANLSATITVPEGATVLIDDVSYTPFSRSGKVTF